MFCPPPQPYCSSQLTVREFKEHIAASVEIPVDKQRLIYQGRVLQDDRTLTEYSESHTHTHFARLPIRYKEPLLHICGMSVKQWVVHIKEFYLSGVHTLHILDV